MNDNVKSTYKSNDTEEWLDRVCYNINTPDTVAVCSHRNLHPN